MAVIPRVYTSLLRSAGAGRPKLTPVQDKMPTLAELGITDRQSSDWQAIIGRLTEAELEEHIGEVSRRSGGEVTTNEGRSPDVLRTPAKHSQWREVD
jgi:hypothetical protein